ncbi:MAG: hypothetical protein D6786_00400 [Gammaproteobacteria bacterium]|nr:MAG: hypothetical protein D6786_00400 [Gammaproteobacteria bacterium]
MHLPRGRTLLLTMLVVLNPALARSAEYAWTPKLDLSAEYSDNRRVTTISHDPAWGVVLDGAVDLSWATETGSASLVPRINLQRFTGSERLDSNNYYLDFDGRHALSERHQFGLSAGWERVATVTSELDDTGTLFTDRTRNRVTNNITPSWTWFHDDRTSLQLAYSYTDVFYQAGRFSGLVDYTYRVASATLTRQLSEIDTLTMTAYQASFNIPDALAKATDYVIQAGYQRQFSPVLSGHLMLGVDRTASEFTDILGASHNTAANSVIFDLGLARETERGHWEVNYSRSISPSGRGDQNRRDEIGLNGYHDFDERLRGVVRARYFDNKSGTGRAGASLDRTFAEVQGRLRWRLGPYWSLEGAYTWRRQSYAASGAVGDSNTLSLGLRYGGEKRAVSR